MLLLDGQLAKAEPKRLRYRLLHVAGRIAFSGRRAKLHLQNMAMGRGSPRRVREAQNAPSANGLTTRQPAPTKPTSPPRDHGCPHTDKKGAAITQNYPQTQRASQHPSRRPHPPPDTSPPSHSHPYCTIRARRLTLPPSPHPTRGRLTKSPSRRLEHSIPNDIS